MIWMLLRRTHCIVYTRQRIEYIPHVRGKDIVSLLIVCVDVVSRYICTKLVFIEESINWYERENSDV